HKTDPTTPNQKIEELITIHARPASFGKQLKGTVKEYGQAVRASPFKACGELRNSADITGKIVIMTRGGCKFLEKARRIQSLGAKGGIVVDNTTRPYNQHYYMSMALGEADNVNIPMVFVFLEDAKPLLQALDENPEMGVILSDYNELRPKFISPATGDDPAIQGSPNAPGSSP
ncbi:unnamed protein product, partial [Meganyctiphanes norvegica]